MGKRVAARVLALVSSVGIAAGLALAAPSMATARPRVGASPAAIHTIVTTPAVDPVAMTRLSGSDRYGTAVAVAKSAFPGTAPIVFLATGANYPDALAAGPVAAKLGGPLLLTTPTTLPSAVGAELTSLAPSTVVVVGGSSIVSGSVVSAIEKILPHTHIGRIAGADRYDTSRRLVQYGFAAGADVRAYLATGADFPDALSAAAAAGAHAQPVVLVRGTSKTLDAATKSLLISRGITDVTIAGGTGVVSGGVQSALTKMLGSTHVSRLGGADRYATSALIASHAFNTAQRVFFATGTNYPDALAGSVAAARSSAPLLTVPATCIPSSSLSVLRASGLGSATIIGGTGAVSDMITALVPCATARPVVRASAIAPVAVGNAPSTVSSGLTGIACPTTSLCRAVGVRSGRPLMGTESKGVWTVSPGPVPSDYSGVAPDYAPLHRIACASSSYCLAIGNYVNKSKHTVGLIETLSGGTWTARVVLPPTGAPVADQVNLSDVSCGSAGQCAVVGMVYGATWSDPETAVIVTDDTGVWSTQRLPSATLTPGSLDQSMELDAVSCLGATCTAVGRSFVDPTVLIATYGTGVWTAARTTDTSLYGLTGVDCPELGQCTAVGPADSGSRPDAIGRVSGDTWTRQSYMTAPSSNNISNQSVQVACASLDFCTSNYEYDHGGATPNLPYVTNLTITGNGRSVSVPAPLPANARGKNGSTANVDLEQMVCPKLGVCIAVGEYTDSQGWIEGVLETLSNGRWSATRIPAPSGETWVDMYRLTDVSCASASTCEAVATTNFIQNYTAKYGGVAISIRL